MSVCANPNCQHPLEPGEKFCSECGTPSAPRPAGPVIGERAVVGGDVIGSKHEIKVLGGSYTNVTHSDESRKVRQCGVCHSNREVVKGHDCPACRRWVCGECFDRVQRRCFSCRDQAQQQADGAYRKLLEEVYADQRVEDAERQRLRAEAQRLGLTPEQAARLEAPFRGARDGGLSRSDELRVGVAEGLLYGEFKLDEAHAELQPLHARHGRRDDRLWRLHVNCLVEHDPEAARQLLEQLDVDDPLAFRRRMELLIRRQELHAASDLLEEARRKFSGMADWEVLSGELLLEEYRCKRHAGYLEEVREHVNRLPEGSPGRARLAACLAAVAGNFQPLRELISRQEAGSEAAFLLQCQQRWLAAPPLTLVLGENSFPCRSGDVIGRQGTVATDRLASIQTLSRRHAQLVLRAGTWCLHILSTTNPSHLDGRLLDSRRFHSLKERHRVRLSSQCEFELKVG